MEFALVNEEFKGRGLKSRVCSLHNLEPVKIHVYFIICLCCITWRSSELFVLLHMPETHMWSLKFQIAYIVTQEKVKMNAIQIKLSFWGMSETNTTPIRVSGQAHKSMHCTCLPVRFFISHLLPDPVFKQHQCGFYLSHYISPFFMVPLKLSSSTFLSISG